MKQINIEQGDADVENDEENNDNVDHVLNDRNIIEKPIKELRICGNTYIYDCKKEKVETSSWFNQLLHNESNIKIPWKK